MLRRVPYCLRLGFCSLLQLCTVSKSKSNFARRLPMQLFSTMVHFEWILIPAGLVTLLVAAQWSTARRHHLAKRDPILHFLERSSSSGLHPSVARDRLAWYGQAGLLQGPQLLRALGRILFIIGIAIVLFRATWLFTRTPEDLSVFLRDSAIAIMHWSFLIWLVVCTAANFAAKSVEASSSRAFLLVVGIRALCVAVGGLIFIA